MDRYEVAQGVGAPGDGVQGDGLKKPRVYCCAICDHPFEMNLSTRGGLYVATYQVNVCMSCYWDNPDGWPREHEAKITWKLLDQGLSPPMRNAKGLLPRGI